MKQLNILLIGSANSFTNQLIRQFNKEGHRVSLLTGSSRSRQKYPRVFERYDFDYTSNVLPEIFTSVSPDVTVFVGAYDGNFSWIDERNDSVSYISAVMNILSAYSSTQKGRFIYVSSDAVYQEESEFLYSEEDELSSGDPRSAAFVQAEDICRQFMMDVKNDIVIVRVGGYYHIPKTTKDVDDFISEFCISYLKNGEVEIPDNSMVMPLAGSDAIFFLSRIILAPSLKYSVYHISSGNRLSVNELKEMIADAARIFGYEVPKGGAKTVNSVQGGWLSSRITMYIQRKEDGRAYKTKEENSKSTFIHLKHSRAMLDSERFKEEFGINRLTDFGKNLEKLVSHILKHKKQFLNIDDGVNSLFGLIVKEVVWLFRIILPFVESTACFFVFFMLNNGLSGNKYFGRIDFYLIYVLLFSILYGQQQAVFSAFLASMGYLYTQFRGGIDSGTLLDFNTYVWIAQLFILGLAVGYLKDRLSDQKEEALYDYEYMTQQIDDVRDINESNVRVKDALHTQIINQNDSIGKMYEITSTLDRYDSEDIFFHAMDVLRQIMGSDDIALYTVSNSAYARLFSATTEIAGSLGNSIRYKELVEMYDELKDGKPYINRKLDKDMPMMACAIRENEEIRTIIMIWNLPWEKMTLGQASILTVTSMLIQNAVLRAHRLLDMMRDDRFIENTRIMKKEAFSSILDTYKKAEQNRLTRFTLLRIYSDNKDEPIIEVGNRATARLRQDDYLGLGNDNNLYILLPNTSPKNAEIVMNRLTAFSINTVVTDTKNKGDTP
ncbi:MAG: NAD(P)-dependent oxidoreductase [Ruminococcus sp.]|nr:NAD(P)-dependent oxidoreductase [Ruminococcus sp.]